MPTDLARQVSERATALARAELAGARAEIAGKAGKAAWYGAAGTIALFGVGGLAVTVAAALALALPGWAAVLITAAALLALAGVAALTGKGHLQRPSGVAEAVENGRRDVEAVRAHLRSGRSPARR